MNPSDPHQELVDDAIAAFEDSTGQLPNDYEVAVIQVSAREYLEEQNK